MDDDDDDDNKGNANDKYDYATINKWGMRE
jgi:hypothetical protein